jgi:HPr kinase/phosphorylase
MSTSVENLLADVTLGLDVAAGNAGLWRHVLTPELNRPSFELNGWFEAFRAERIQIFGKGEVSFILEHEDQPGLRDNMGRILAGEVPCAIVTNGLKPPAPLIEVAESLSIPVLSCRHSTTKLYKRLWEHLDSEFAPQTTMHGVLLDIHDIGVLLLGDSSVGKSECALELIRRGFHLIADDMVTIKCLSDSQLVGRATDMLPYHMEARGIGIIDICRLFGAAAVRPDKRISLAITLVEWDQTGEIDRTGLDEKSLEILDVSISHLIIPVRPGRNVGTLVEVAALNHKLKSLGINSAVQAEEILLDQLDAARRDAE